MHSSRFGHPTQASTRAKHPNLPAHSKVVKHLSDNAASTPMRSLESNATVGPERSFFLLSAIIKLFLLSPSVARRSPATARPGYGIGAWRLRQFIVSVPELRHFQNSHLAVKFDWLLVNAIDRGAVQLDQTLDPGSKSSASQRTKSLA